MTPEERALFDWSAMQASAMIHTDISAARLDNPWTSKVVLPLWYLQHLPVSLRAYKEEFLMVAETKISSQVQEFLTPLLDPNVNKAPRFEHAVEQLKAYLYRWGLTRSEQEQDSVIKQIQPVFDRLYGLGLISDSFRLYFENRYRMTLLHRPVERV